MRVVIAYLAAVMAAFVLGAAALSWFDQAGFAMAHGGDLSVAQRAGWFVATMQGLALGVGMYPVLLAAGLLIAFIVAAIVKRLAPDLRFWWYAGAGAVALVVMVLTLKAALGLFVLPGARTPAGIAAQGFAGLVAGAVFAVMTRPRERRGSFG